MTRKQLDTVFKSLANSDRRAVLTVLNEHPGMTVNELAERVNISRYALMKHLKLLEDAGLVRPKRNGRSKELHYRPGPIRRLMEGWLADHANLEQVEQQAKEAAERMTSEFNRLMGTPVAEVDPIEPASPPPEPVSQGSANDGADPLFGTEAPVAPAVPTPAKTPAAPAAPTPAKTPAADPLSWMLG